VAWFFLIFAQAFDDGHRRRDDNSRSKIHNARNDSSKNFHRDTMRDRLLDEDRSVKLIIRGSIHAARDS
jgi:hypothetical protein